MNLSDPATKQDLQDLKTEISQLRAEVIRAIQEAELRQAQRLERAETALLNGFRNYARRAATTQASV